MNYTDYHLVQDVYQKNHEIASHTLYHVADPGGCTPAAKGVVSQPTEPAGGALPWGPRGGGNRADMLTCVPPLLHPADLFQIVGMKLWLNQTAHVPLEKIRVSRVAGRASLLSQLAPSAGWLALASADGRAERCPWLHSLCRASARPSSSTAPSSAPSCSRTVGRAAASRLSPAASADGGAPRQREERAAGRVPTIPLAVPSP
jgi:hypothetical protein